MTLKSWWADDGNLFPRAVRNLLHSRVKIYQMRYDAEKDCYIEHSWYETKRAIHETYPHALHVTGESAWYAMEIGTPKWSEPGTCTATDLYLYAVNHSIDDALFYKLKPRFKIDMKMIGIVVVAIVAVVFVYGSGMVKLG